MEKKKDPLNHLLLEEFPSISEHYTTYKDGVFDLDTPASSFYEELFVPYVIKCYQEKNEKELIHCCDFIERMMTEEEELNNDIAMNHILCPLYESKKIDFSLLPLGRVSKEYVREWLEE